MLLRSTILPLILVVIGVSAPTAEAHSFVPRESLTKPKGPSTNVLELRGGAGPLDPSDTAKVATALSLVNAVVCTLSTKKASEIYGMTRSPMVDRYTEMIGTTLLSSALSAYCLFFKKTSGAGAVGVSAFPWIVFALKDVLNETPKELGIDMAGSYLLLAITSICAYCLLSGNNVDTAWKFLSLFVFGNGVVLGLAPETGNKMWGVNSADSMVNFLTRTHGFFLAALGTFAYALNQGVDNVKAFGYSWIPMMLNLVDSNFITNGASEHGMEKGPQYFWMLVMSVFIYTMAL